MVVSMALLASVLTARGDTNDYVREEWTERMGASWPSTAQVVHWHEKDGAQHAGKAWAIKFDMDDTRWRFTTRLGLNNTTDTNNSHLATLKQMAGKFEDEGRKPMVAINGNYFDHENGFINIYGALWSDGKRLVGGPPKFHDNTAREFSIGASTMAVGSGGWPRDMSGNKIRSGTDFYADPPIRYKDGVYYPPAKTDPKSDGVDTYPRSLVGVGTNELGRSFLVLFVSDGRQNDWSYGFSDHDAVSLVVSLGCRVVAENDGGGSAGMWIKGLKKEEDGGLAPRDEEYINKGSDGGPRAVAAGLFMMYEEPFVERITSQQGAYSDPFENLDDAFMMGEDGEMLWVKEDVPLKASATNTHSCMIIRDAFASHSTAVRIANGVEWTVGASVTLQNITIAGEADGSPRPWINVLKGSTLTVSDDVGALRLRTADKDGFQISSEQPLWNSVAVDCATAATNKPAFFGKVSRAVSDEVLAESIALLENPNDSSQIAAVEERSQVRYLKWLPGCVRVNGGRRYGTLEDAIAAVAGMDNSTIEIIAPATLTKSCVIPTNCTITATNENAYAAAVNVAPGATLTVGAGARVLFRNIVFTNAAQSVAVEVAPRGTAAVAGLVELGEVRLLKDRKDPSSDPARGVFELAGPLTGDVRVIRDPREGEKLGDTIGSSSLPLEEARTSAGHVVNDADDELAGEAYEDSDGSVKIRWKVAEVTDENAVARFISEDDVTTNNYKSLRMLFRELKESGRIELLEETCSLVEPATIPSGKSITMFSAGEDPAVVKLPASNGWKTDAVISVCGALSVENIVFDGSGMPPGGSSLSVFRVYRNAFLELGAAAGIQDVTLAAQNGASKEMKGVVYVLNGGTFQMGDGSFVTGCSGGGSGAAAIYLSQSGAAARLMGGHIEGCVHPNGAVYAASGATIEVSGDTIVIGNTNNSGATRNIMPRGDGDLKLVGVLTGRVGVNFGNADDAQFGVVTGGGDSADHFVCDTKTAKGETLLGSASNGTLVWKATVVVPPPNVEVNGKTYGTLADAVAAAADGDTLTILAPIAVSSMPVRIDRALTITASDPTNVIRRGASGELSVNTVARAIEIASTGVVFRNIVLGDDDREWPRAFVHVLEGGELTLGEGAVVRNVRATAMMREGRMEPIGRSAAGVLVAGTLIMEDGSAIVSCVNRFDQSAGGGVLASGSGAAFDFRGGTVSGCSASRGGGVCIEKHAKALVRGGGTILDNANGNLYVAAESPLEIADVFTGRIDYREGVVRPDTETNIFADVTYDYADDLDALAAGAIRFTNELTRACGVAVTNGAGAASYIWNTALATSTTYEKDDNRWVPIGEVPPQPSPDPGPVPPGPTPEPPEIVDPYPIAFTSIEKTDAEWVLVATNARRWCWYSLWSGTSLKTNEYEVVKVGGQLLSNQWNQADGPITNRVPVVESEPVRFWIIRGASGEVPAP